MSALNAASVVYTPQGKGPGIKDDSSVRQMTLKAVFGDGSSTYPSGGIPLSGLSAWGFPNVVGEVFITDASNGDGYIYKWDKLNNKLRIYYATNAHNHTLFLKDAAQTDAAGNRVNAAASNKLGANTGTSISVVGVPDTTGNGGIVSIAAAAGSEVSTSFAPASNTTLFLVVRGF